MHSNLEKGPESLRKSIVKNCKVMKSRTVRISECTCSYVPTEPPDELHEANPVMLTLGSLPYPESESNVDTKWLDDIRNSLLFSPYDTLEIYEAVSKFQKPTVISWKHLYSLFLKKEDVHFLRLMWWLFCFVLMLNDLEMGSDVLRI